MLPADHDDEPLRVEILSNLMQLQAEWLRVEIFTPEMHDDGPPVGVDVQPVSELSESSAAAAVPLLSELSGPQRLLNTTFVAGRPHRAHRNSMRTRHPKM